MDFEYIHHIFCITQNENLLHIFITSMVPFRILVLHLILHYFLNKIYLLFLTFYYFLGISSQSTPLLLHHEESLFGTLVLIFFLLILVLLLLLLMFGLIFLFYLLGPVVPLGDLLIAFPLLLSFGLIPHSLLFPFL